MIRHLTVLLVLSLTVFSLVVAAEERPAESHQGTLEEQRACRSDVARHCRSVQDKGDDAMVDCLKANIKKLKPSCRQVIELLVEN
jgi:hypothetical protein